MSEISDDDFITLMNGEPASHEDLEEICDLADLAIIGSPVITRAAYERDRPSGNVVISSCLQAQGSEQELSSCIDFYVRPDGLDRDTPDIYDHMKPFATFDFSSSRQKMGRLLLGDEHVTFTDDMAQAVREISAEILLRQWYRAEQYVFTHLSQVVGRLIGATSGEPVDSFVFTDTQKPAPIQEFAHLLTGMFCPVITIQQQDAIPYDADSFVYASRFRQKIGTKVPNITEDFIATHDKCHVELYEGDERKVAVYIYNNGSSFEVFMGQDELTAAQLEHQKQTGDIFRPPKISKTTANQVIDSLKAATIHSV